MTPTQLTVIVEALSSLGHVLPGMATCGIHVAVTPAAFEALQQLEHEHAQTLLAHLLVLPEAVLSGDTAAGQR